jgi:hypothetical protein
MTATIGSAPLDHDFGGRIDQVVDRAIEEGRIVGLAFRTDRGWNNGARITKAGLDDRGYRRSGGDHQDHVVLSGMPQIVDSQVRLTANRTTEPQSSPPLARMAHLNSAKSIAQVP